MLGQDGLATKTASPGNVDYPSLAALVLSLLRTSVVRTTSLHRFNHAVMTTLAEPEFLDECWRTTSIDFAPGLLEIIQSNTAPTISSFQDMTTEIQTSGAVYFQRGSPPMVYVGSATEKKYGVVNRMRGYDNGNQVPNLVAKALMDNYEITT